MRTKWTKILFAIGTAFQLSGCSEPRPAATSSDQISQLSSADITEAPNSETSFSLTEPLPEPVVSEPVVIEDNQVQAIFSSMTLEEKIAMMFVVTPEILSGGSNVTDAAQIIENWKAIPVGGIIFFPNNFVSTEQTQLMLQALKQASIEKYGVPLFLGVDEEGGEVARVAASGIVGIESQPLTSQIGATLNIEEAYASGFQIGQYLSVLGFNVDFAPVADILTNPENTVIGTRAYGSDPQVVKDMAYAFSQGLEDNQVLPVWKHFPGHGDTYEDSHTSLAQTLKTLEELQSCELIPFQYAAQMGIPLIMAGHVSAPNVTGNSLPASLSPEILTGILRNQLGYAGLIVTDAMNMGAVANLFSSEEAALMSINAGADLILMTRDFPSDYQAVITAVQNGQISEDRINDSILRILNVLCSMS